MNDHFVLHRIARRNSEQDYFPSWLHTATERPDCDENGASKSMTTGPENADRRHSTSEPRYFAGASARGGSSTQCRGIGRVRSRTGAGQVDVPLTSLRTTASDEARLLLCLREMGEVQGQNKRTNFVSTSISRKTEAPIILTTTERYRSFG